MALGQQTQTATTDIQESNRNADAKVQDLLAQKNVADNNVEDIEFDRLRMYFGEPYTVVENFVIYEPTIGDIIDYGEKDFLSMLNIFISHTTQYRLQLWKMGIDWNKISDFKLFGMLSHNLIPEQTAVFFKDVDFSKFKLIEIPLTDEQKAENKAHKDDKGFKRHRKQFFMVNDEQKILLDEHRYNVMSTYMRTMFNIFPKVEKTRSRSTKESIIWEEEDNLAHAKKDKNQNKSFFLPLISSCINHPGFKYKLSELRDVGIVQFMDSVQRLQVYESTHALNIGRFSGFCDTSKIDQNLFNFMRDLSSSK